MLRLVLDYVTGVSGKGWRYRRAVPVKLRKIIGKREFKLFLGDTEAEAIRSYVPFHAVVERQLKDAARQLAGGGPAADTDLSRYHALREKLRALGVDPNEAPDQIDPDSERHRHADAILDAYPVETDPAHPEYGSPRLPEAMAALARALVNGMPAEPSPSLTDAARMYLRERARTDSVEDKKVRQRIERVVDNACSALGGDRKVAALKPVDAIAVRNHLTTLHGSPETVRRYLNDLQGVVGLAIKLMGLSMRNPFADLPSLETDAERAKRIGAKRNQVPLAELEAAVTSVRERLKRHADPDLLNIWLLLENTGCRLKEITGLRREDAFVSEGQIPYVALQFTENRRLKNFSSVRDMPLVPVARKAVEGALSRAVGRDLLFPKYGDGQAGADRASAALMKHVRAVTKDKRIVVHSLRHRAAARLEAAGVPHETRERIVGHGADSIANGYRNSDVTFASVARSLAQAFAEDTPATSE